MQSSPSERQLQRIYGARFAGNVAYRTKVWKVLVSYFGRWFPGARAVLDLGAGYCEFINNVPADVRYAMDLNPDVRQLASPGVIVLHQDCAQPWPLPESTLDLVFTSNFLEHLPDKSSVSAVLSNAYRSLKPGGRLVAIGPNIKYVLGAYWDFFDHYIPLTDLSLAEALSNCDFEIETRIPRFLPFTMAHGSYRHPLWMLRLYLALPFVWRIFGKQFLIVGRKPE